METPTVQGKRATTIVGAQPQHPRPHMVLAGAVNSAMADRVHSTGPAASGTRRSTSLQEAQSHSSCGWLASPAQRR